MHSSRMRTGRSLTVCRSLLPRGGVCCGGGCLLPGVSVPGGVCSGGSAPRGVSAPGVSAPRGCLLLGGCLFPLGCLLWGVSAPGRCLLRGCLLWGGVCSRGAGILACTEADTPPVNRMTNRCKNITLATTKPVIKTAFCFVHMSA